MIQEAFGAGCRVSSNPRKKDLHRKEMMKALTLIATSAAESPRRGSVANLRTVSNQEAPRFLIRTLVLIASSEQEATRCPEKMAALSA